MATIQKAKSEWQRFKSDEPGKRFQNFHERRQRQQGHKFDLRFLLGGALLTALGLFLMPAPGPGALVVAFGLALLGSQFGPMAKLLDRFEVRGRAALQAGRGFWKRASLVGRAGVVLVAGVFAVMGVSLALRIFHALR